MAVVLVCSSSGEAPRHITGVANNEKPASNIARRSRRVPDDAKDPRRMLPYGSRRRSAGWCLLPLASREEAAMLATTHACGHVHLPTLPSHLARAGYSRGVLGAAVSRASARKIPGRKCIRKCGQAQGPPSPGDHQVASMMTAFRTSRLPSRLPRLLSRQPLQRLAWLGSLGAVSAMPCSDRFVCTRSMVIWL
jgi:hypothetical protein